MATKSGFVHGYDTCPDCGKVRYATRPQAKKRMRQFRGRQGRLNAYRCGDWWHIGHLPRVVTAGDLSRDEIHPRQPKESR